VTDHSRITAEVRRHQHDGSGTEDDPFIVTWLPRDPGNPMEFPTAKKWFLSGIVAVSMLATAFSSSAFTGKYWRIFAGFG
jgi:hypothetical protein